MPSLAEVRPIVWRGGRLYLLDQRKLPATETFVELHGARDSARSIRTMVVRGAPAIGVTAAFGLAMEAPRFRRGRAAEDFERAAALLEASRPTAVNLRWAIARVRERLESTLAELGHEAPVRRIAAALRREAETMMAADIAVNRKLGEHGARLLKGARGVLTHCNAGALATAGYGTALGVIRSAWQAGDRFDVYATETRPYLQGARLTCWEFRKLGIPVTLLSDSMVGALFQGGAVSAVVVGTDRTAANGDVANKIGTYPIAVLAERHSIDFYVAAPTSSIDLSCCDGSVIPIEQRDGRELTHWHGRRVAADDVAVFNPAFDVTPAGLVSGIITEVGVVRKNYQRALAAAVAKARKDASITR